MKGNIVTVPQSEMKEYEKIVREHEGLHHSWKDREETHGLHYIYKNKNQHYNERYNRQRTFEDLLKLLLIT